MAQPITWRNINSESPARAAIPMELAQRGMNSAFDNFQKVLQQQEATSAQNVLAQGEIQKQNFLNALQGARTPEQLAALEASGQLQAQFQALSPQAQGQVRDAPDARLSTLRTRLTQEQAFNDAQLDKTQAPIRNSILSKAVRGDAKGALDELGANPDLRNSAELTKAIVSGERDFTRFGWDAEAEKRKAAEEGRKGELHPLDVKLKKADIGLKGTQTAAAQANLTAARLAAQDVQDVRALTADLAQFAAAARSGPGAVVGDDTALAGEWIKLQQAKGVRPDLLERVKPYLEPALSSRGPNPIGVDALKLAQEEAAREEQNANNPYAPGSPNALRNYDEIAKEIPLLFKDKGTGAAKDVEDVPALQKTLYELSTQGININGVTVTPSKNDVLGALRSVESGLFSDDRSSKRMLELLKERLSTPESLARIQQGEINAKAERDAKVLKKLTGAKPDSKKEPKK